MRAIRSTGELVPAVGLGTFMTFDVLPGRKSDHLRDVMRLFWEGGGRVIDTSPLYGTAEITVGDFALIRQEGNVDLATVAAAARDRHRIRPAAQSGV